MRRMQACIYVHGLTQTHTHLVASLSLAVAKKASTCRFASAMTAWFTEAAAKACAGTSSSFQEVSSHWSTFRRESQKQRRGRKARDGGNQEEQTQQRSL